MGCLHARRRPLAAAVRWTPLGALAQCAASPWRAATSGRCAALGEEATGPRATARSMMGAASTEGRGNAERHLCHQPARHVRGRATRRAMVMLRLWEDAGAAHRPYLAGARGRRCQPPQWGMATGWAAPRHERPWSSLPSAAGSADTQGPRQAQPSLDA
uniref:Predicted protein n=1 Tax=Hordeum vulgare subsp. vulgare TaxID=112509 RepID=F2D859_HORVV|nr:predicted protein [Hordeum vulgare subsp. vulgare]BAK00966.1 predicted protein [Hordeum vulgare subsp. vulgare]